MKTKLFAGTAAALGLMCALGSAAFGTTVYTNGQTGTIVIDRISTGSEIYGGAPGYKNGSTYTPSVTDATDGGEFTLITNGGVVGTPSGYATTTIVTDPNESSEAGFQSFCLETNVGFPDSTSNGLPTSSLDYKIGSTIINNPTEILNLGTAYLYSQFAAGTLSQYNYTSTAPFFDGTLGTVSLRAESAAELQSAIWYLEGQYGATGTLFSSSTAYTDAGGSNNAFLSLVDSTLGLTSSNASAGAYGVEVMNIGLPSTTPQYDDQAQLVIVPTTAPDGGTTVLLMGIALGGLFLIKRRLAA